LLFIIVEVETAPATSEVIVFPADETVLFIDEVATTPFISVVIIPVPIFTELEDTTLDVATTPFIVVVRVLPDKVCVNEFIIFVMADAIPFTKVVNVFVVVEIVFVVPPASTEVNEVVDTTPFTFEVKMVPEADNVLLVIILLVPTDPPTFEDIMFPIAESIFETERLLTLKFEIVAFVANRLSVFVVDAVRL
jgi:hypothetical protein